MKNQTFLVGALMIVALGGTYYVVSKESAATQTMEVSAQGPSAHALLLPEDAIKLTDCVPFMGEHWARPQDLPSGPIYMVHEGEVIGSEYMIFEERLEGEASIIDVGPHEMGIPVTLPSLGGTYDHTDLGYQPEGHEGMEAPHYDIHNYVISPEEKFNVCPPPAEMFEAMGTSVDAMAEAYANLHPVDLEE